MAHTGNFHGKSVDINSSVNFALRPRSRLLTSQVYLPKIRWLIQENKEYLSF